MKTIEYCKDVMEKITNTDIKLNEYDKFFEVIIDECVKVVIETEEDKGIVNINIDFSLKKDEFSTRELSFVKKFVKFLNLELEDELNEKVNLIKRYIKIDLLDIRYGIQVDKDILLSYEDFIYNELRAIDNMINTFEFIRNEEDIDYLKVYLLVLDFIIKNYLISYVTYENSDISELIS